MNGRADLTRTYRQHAGDRPAGPCSAAANLSSRVRVQKAGVTLAQIVPATGVQGTLFAPPDKGKHARLMEALDRVNKVYGRGSIVIAAQGTEPFRMNREHLSPRYTTDWRELLTVKAK